jgi:hypothetical protein
VADVLGLERLSRQHDWVPGSIAAFFGVPLVGVLEGIAIAVALSLLSVFRVVALSDDPRAVPGRAASTTASCTPRPKQLPGLVI